MKASIIFNPNAGTRDMQQQLKQAGNHLKKQGWQISWCETTHAGHAIDLAKDVANKGHDIAIAVGGDGTLNEVVNGLVGSKTALGILPAGTANVFAADINIPVPGPSFSNSLLKAADCLLTGKIHRIDVAQIQLNDGSTRYFLLWAGAGLDAAISRAFTTDAVKNPEIKVFGILAWFVAGFATLRDFRGKEMTITVDETTIKRRAIIIGICNSQLYGRFWRLAPDAKLDDGLLDVVILEGYTPINALKHLAMMTLGRHTRYAKVHIYRTKQVKIEAVEPLPVHVDAENAGFTPIKANVVPAALNVIMPKNVPDYHFTNKNTNSMDNG